MSSLVSQYYPSRFIRADALPQRRGVYTIEKVGEEEMRNDNGQVRKQLCLGLKELEQASVVMEHRVRLRQMGYAADDGSLRRPGCDAQRPRGVFQPREQEDLP